MEGGEKEREGKREESGGREERGRKRARERGRGRAGGGEGGGGREGKGGRKTRTGCLRSSEGFTGSSWVNDEIRKRKVFILTHRILAESIQLRKMNDLILSEMTYNRELTEKAAQCLMEAKVPIAPSGKEGRGDLLTGLQ